MFAHTDSLQSIRSIEEDQTKRDPFDIRYSHA